MLSTLSTKFMVRALLLLALVFLPLFGGDYLVYLINVGLIFAIFAIAYDLFYGYTDLVSFGHSAFYGIPAYVVGIFSVTVFDIKNPVILIALAIATGALLGLMMGFLCSFARGIYMALITFAFCEILFLLVMSDPGGITLGENAITRILPSSSHGHSVFLYLFKGTGLYYSTLFSLVALYVALRALVNSQLGDILTGIRDNEDRLPSLGYNPRPYKILVFMLSAMITALAGALMAFLNNSVVPSMAEWHVGADVLLITILGGAGTLIGPIIGAFLIVFTQFYASSVIGGGNWVYVLGCLYICVVMFLPGGIVNTKVGSFLK
jgi:ABC-type branched-subunit amino acid transport system permease subunit